MTYEQSLEYLASLNRFGISLGLKRIQRLLELMHHPERRYKTIHITGTNGKGSTTAMVASILKAAGIKTGMYISPHLVEYTERMLVDGEQINRGAFAQAIEYTKGYIDRMTAEGEEHPTEFEVITAAAFHYFATAGVEYAVIEVGLGGLLDSTNVIIPIASVITNVALEHTDRCGDTVEAIALHKAGIIKRGIPVVTAVAGAALEVIIREAAAKQAPVYRLGTDFAVFPVSTGREGQQFMWEHNHARVGPVALKLLGKHQIHNAALAMMTAYVLAVNDHRVSEPAITGGLAATRWPGRFEWIQDHPVIIIDGAHNPAGAQSLRAALDEYFPKKGITFVLGILKDKDRRQIIDRLIRECDYAVTVSPLSERAASPEELAILICGSRVESQPSLRMGIDRAVEVAGPQGVVCITGSLYLVGPAREIVYNR
jgi:dihydrofolate synthase/folylpolyglutamate synthase